MFKKENKLYKCLKKRIIKEDNVNAIMQAFNKTQIELPKDKLIEGDYTLLDDIEGRIGLYYFEVKRVSNNKTWDDLKKAWGKIKHTPNFIKKRCEYQEFKDDTFLPFYIGKTEGEIKKRIHQHIYAVSKDNSYLKSTYTLRLKQHYENKDIRDIMNCFLFRVSYVTLEIELEFLPILESEIRNKKMCMVGKG